MVHQMMGEVDSCQAGTARHWKFGSGGGGGGGGEGGEYLWGHDQGCPHVAVQVFCTGERNSPSSVSLLLAGTVSASQGGRTAT